MPRVLPLPSHPALLRVLRWSGFFLLGFMGISAAWVLIYRVVPVPGTPLMLIRLAQGAPGVDRIWVRLEDISPHLTRAVIAAEDTRFCRHGGIDWDAVEQARKANARANTRGRNLRGASTISMQTAKNAFLWPDRTWFRKGLELWFTSLAELAWPKRRILEIYLNIAEWGNGIYGAEAAARRFFGKPARDLTRREAAMMAAVLPNPRRWSPVNPTRYIAGRSGVIERRMSIVARDDLADCVL